MDLKNDTHAPGSAVRGPVDIILPAIAATTVAATIVQFALAGLGTFGEVHDKKVGDAYFAAHQTLGMVIGLLTLIAVVVTLIVRRSRKPVILSTVLFVLAGPVQPVLGTLGADSAAWVGALHAVNGLAILALAGNLLNETRTRRRPA